jgi:tRNA(Ile)-lysidine synthase
LCAAWIEGAELARFDAKHGPGVAFDRDQLHFPLHVRAWQPGDRLAPFGGSGRIKVSDLLTNAKIPMPLRERWPLLLHGTEVLWVVGLRRGEQAPLRPETRRAVRVWVEEVEEAGRVEPR